MGDRHVFQAVNQRHGIPADGAAPEAGREAGRFIGPRLGAGLVPGVVMKLLIGIPTVAIHEDELLRHIVVEGGLVEGLGVVGEEWRRHEKTIQPHLVWIALLVPETALTGPGVVAHLLAQGLDGGAQRGRTVALFPGEDEDFARGDEVDVVFVFTIPGDGTIGADEGSGGARAVNGKGRVARLGGKAHQGQADERGGVGPLGFGVGVVEHALPLARHLRAGHADGPFERGGVAEFLRRRGRRSGRRCGVKERTNQDQG